MSRIRQEALPHAVTRILSCHYRAGQRNAVSGPLLSQQEQAKDGKNNAQNSGERRGFSKQEDSGKRHKCSAAGENHWDRG